ncbi:hypothetical protein RX717_02445 [Intestinibacillus sp. NTUH-41-i26]|uniref:hypothetical protein n=1 Tax=Butyricicoccaceae TaxID=3085642 RepID=UPI0018FECE60|nr:MULTISPECIES: hypothetical protein [Butyricicoccaceae]WOC75874.1 hypothetical protein RX717_02445 [Intestinibacillus sp. NTUH-41-i26]
MSPYPHLRDRRGGHQPGDSFDFDAERGCIARWPCMLRFCTPISCATAARFHASRPALHASVVRMRIPPMCSFSNGSRMGAGDRAAPIHAIRQAKRECGSCGCALDRLYPLARALLG